MLTETDKAVDGAVHLGLIGRAYVLHTAGKEVVNLLLELAGEDPFLRVGVRGCEDFSPGVVRDPVSKASNRRVGKTPGQDGLGRFRGRDVALGRQSQ